VIARSIAAVLAQLMRRLRDWASDTRPREFTAHTRETWVLILSPKANIAARSAAAVGGNDRLESFGYATDEMWGVPTTSARMR
jgi:hypothetical protein